MPIALAVIAGLISLSFLIHGYRNLDSANNWAKLLQALITLMAFGLAAYWYFVERKDMPHADVTQEVIVSPVAPGVVSVEAHVRIRNLGQRLLRIDRIYSRLQEVQGESYDYSALADRQGDEYWHARRPGTRAAQFSRAELRWPIIRQFEDQVVHEIEPGETDLFVATFLIRCSRFRHIRVASDVNKPGSDPDHPLAWKARTFANLDQACADDGNARRDNRNRRM